MFANLFARKAHDVELIFIFVEVKHVAHVYWPRFYSSIKLQWSIESNVGPRHFQLKVQNKVVES